MGTNGHKSAFLPLRHVAPAHPPTEEALHLQGSFDGASETRTRDLLGAIQALSQLSYSPVRPGDRPDGTTQV